MLLDKELKSDEAIWTSNAIDVILHKVSKIDTLMTMQQRQEALLEKLSDAVSRLAVIEDRQNSDREWVKEITKDHKDTVQRICTRLDKLDERLDTLETKEPLNSQARHWLLGGIGIALAAILAALLKSVGLK